MPDDTRTGTGLAELTTPTERNPLFRVADAVTATAMRTGSTLRSARIFHPQGVAYRATVDIRPGSAGSSHDGTRTGVRLLDEPGSYGGLVRFSRGGSLPEPLPDVLGIAVRIEDAHGPGQDQDILLGSSFEAPLARQLLLPAVAFRGATLSSVLPYRLGELGTVLLGARLRTAEGRALAQLPDLEQAIDAGDLRLDLRYASRWGAWHSFADVRIGERLPAEESDELTFNVDENTGGGLAPQGWWQALRRHAYAASQAARGA
jgi:hypothetical protein